MQDASLSPNAITYAAAVSACAKRGLWEQAIASLSEKARAIEPGTVAYGAAIRACESGLQPEQALKLLQDIESTSPEPVSVSLYNSALGACEKSTWWRSSLYLLSDTIGKGTQADLTSYSTVLSACERAGRWRHAFLLLHDMAHCGIDAVCMAQALGVSVTAGQWAQFRSLQLDLQRVVRVVASGSQLIATGNAVLLNDLLWRHHVPATKELEFVQRHALFPGAQSLLNLIAPRSMSVISCHHRAFRDPILEEVFLLGVGSTREAFSVLRWQADNVMAFVTSVSWDKLMAQPNSLIADLPENSDTKVILARVTF